MKPSSVSNIGESIQDRIKARQAAEAAFQLISESVEGVESRYWTVLRDLILQKAPLKSETADQVPYTNQEADRFGITTMPFGQFAGSTIDRVPLKYLDWLTGESDVFKVALRRYLLNPVVRERLREEIATRDDL